MPPSKRSKLDVPLSHGTKSQLILYQKLLFLIYTASLYRQLESCNRKVIGCADTINVYVRGPTKADNTEQLRTIIHDHNQPATPHYTAFDYGDKLSFMHVDPSRKSELEVHEAVLTLPSGDKRAPLKQLKLFEVHQDIKKKFRNATEKLGPPFPARGSYCGTQ